MHCGIFVPVVQRTVAAVKGRLAAKASRHTSLSLSWSYAPLFFLTNGWIAVLGAAALALWAVPARAAGFARNADFIVFADDQPLAEAVIAKASQYRKELALRWLGEELPPAVGRTVINVTISDREDRGLIWPADGPGRQVHNIWLTTSRQRALGSTLKHEIAHAVLATRYPRELPVFVNEAVANLQDDEERKEIRQRTIGWFARTGNWPPIREVFEADVISSVDSASYAVASSVTEYLCTRSSETKFLEFAIAGKQHGWDAALRSHYGINSVEQLQQLWQQWVLQTIQARPTGNVARSHGTVGPQ